MIKMKTCCLALGLLLTSAALSETPGVEDGTYTCDIIAKYQTNIFGGFTSYNDRAGHSAYRQGYETGRLERTYSVDQATTTEITFSDNAQVVTYEGIEAQMWGYVDTFPDALQFAGRHKDTVITALVFSDESLGPYDISLQASIALPYKTTLTALRCYL